MRQRMRHVGGVCFIEDCYNASPDSVRAAFATLHEVRAQRRIAVLGDMLELGEQEKEMHRDMGAYAAKKGLDLVLCQGELAKEIAAGAGERGRWFESKQALIAALPGLIRAGDRVLVKASRGMRFEEVAEALKQL